jgi:hypothetical protein
VIDRQELPTHTSDYENRTSASSPSPPERTDCSR